MSRWKRKSDGLVVEMLGEADDSVSLLTTAPPFRCLEAPKTDFLQAFEPAPDAPPFAVPMTTTTMDATSPPRPVDLPPEVRTVRALLTILERKVDARTAELESRIKALEARPAVTVAPAGALTAAEEWKRRLDALRARARIQCAAVPPEPGVDRSFYSGLAEGLTRSVRIMEGKVVE